MPRILSSVGLFAAVLLLAGCSVFYPNWGATSLPSPSETQTLAEPTESATAEETPVEQPQESQSPEPEATETPAVVRKEVTVEIIMAVPEPDYGALTVVAQIPTLSESGGKCIFRFISGSTDTSMEVKAEPSSDYTQCYPIEYPLADLPKGNGVVTVTYESEEHFGTSAPVSVVIG